MSNWRDTSGSLDVCQQCNCVPCYCDRSKEYTINLGNNTDEGWVCPKCGSVYAPWNPECRKCSD